MFRLRCSGLDFLIITILFGVLCESNARLIKKDNCIEKPSTQCKTDELKCNDGKCLPSKSVCNGYIDCEDGSDEKNCTRNYCKITQFSCQDGKKCVPKGSVCDGLNDCDDMSDEIGCERREKTPIINSPETYKITKSAKTSTSSTSTKCNNSEKNDCECNGHSEDCTCNGKCLHCQHNTMGQKCERCLPGYKGDATRGTPYDCVLVVNTENEEPENQQVLQESQEQQYDLYESFEEIEKRKDQITSEENEKPEKQEQQDDEFKSASEAIEINNFIKRKTNPAKTTTFATDTTNISTKCNNSKEIDCKCNGHSEDCTCDGKCVNCKHNTRGDRCQYCKPGYVGNATKGTPNDCFQLQKYNYIRP